MAKTPSDIRSLARSHTEMAVQQLAGIAQHGQSESAKVSACSVLLDRGWGKAPQSIDLDAKIGVSNPLLELFERIAVDGRKLHDPA